MSGSGPKQPDADIGLQPAAVRQEALIACPVEVREEYEGLDLPTLSYIFGA